MTGWECGGRSLLPGFGVSPIGINLSISVGARAVERGREGLYGRPPWAAYRRWLVDEQPACPSRATIQEDAQQRCQDVFQASKAANPPRIVLYWHNGRSLGHTVRCATLGQALLDRLPGSIVVGITGASKGLELLPPGMDLVKIPSYLTYDETGGVRITPIISLTHEEFQRIRENLIFTFVRDFQPGAMVVDFHPGGKNGELIPAIISSPDTKKVLGLRGILGSPAETNRGFFNSRLIAFIQDYFSAIHIYIDERVFRLEDYYSIPASLSAMFKYTGYVTRPTVASKAEARAILRLDSDARIIVVSFGGGQGTEPIWQSILHSLSKIRDRFDFACLSAGPYLEADAYERLRTQVSQQHPNWTWTRLLDPLPVWIKASNFFIGSGGYNSLAETIATGANALIIPRQLNEHEQELHATRLANLNILRIANLETVLSEDLTPLVEMCLAEPYPYEHNIKVATDGAKRSASLIESIIA
jgi:predicted glycosyltransferase